MFVLHLFALLSFLVALRTFRDYQRRRGIPYPPGPRPLPIVGNLFDLPKEFLWLAFTQLSKKHGDILSLHIFGRVLVVLSSHKAIKDLLERRGDIYSDRPVIPIYKMMDWEWSLSLTKYGESWRLSRRLIDRGLRPGPVAAYRPMQQMKTRLLLTRILASPHQWEAHVELLQGEMILAMTYGYEVQGRGDRKIDVSRQFIRMSVETATPRDLLVNAIPFLRHIPEWLPWFSYKPLARVGRDLGREVVNEPIRFVRESMLNGTARPSLALENLQEAEKLSGSEREEAEKTIANALGSMYTAGADSTASVIMSFFVGVLLRPDIQSKAQAELDSVTGRQRLPIFEDRPRLPFIDAVCKETLRWMPVAPVAIPHSTTKDDVYEGFFIPKAGAVVVGNTWAILHDPAMYPEPDVFKPERFLNPDGTLRDDPVLTSAFGYGRRICPGRHFVDTTLFITVASLLSVFNIEKGSDGPVNYTYTGGVLM
ncbi:cytochrome P450 [Lactifluus subvellereus]|nr:cytochrome P450 [Lactifluus subvellereus]